MWLNEMSMMTVVSFAKSADGHRIQCNSWNGASFQVHTEAGIVKFKKSKEGPNFHQFSPEFIASTKKHDAQLLGAVKENATGHTNQQQERAEKAQKLHHIVGAPTVQNFKCLIESNQIRNCLVTMDNIEIAEKIHRKDVSCLKGKTV